MLFDSKLAEIERHIAYIRAACEASLANAHPNLTERLRLVLEAAGDLVPAMPESTNNTQTQVKLGGS